MALSDTIRDYARQIADAIIASARNSGDDPIAWVTGNAFMPPLRSFPQAEEIYQLDSGEDWEMLCGLVGEHVSESDVLLDCPDYGNALYAIDLARFEYRENENGEYLQDNWPAIA